MHSTSSDLWRGNFNPYQNICKEITNNETENRSINACLSNSMQT